jgi:hypothetical protein
MRCRTSPHAAFPLAKSFGNDECCRSAFNGKRLWGDAHRHRQRPQQLPLGTTRVHGQSCLAGGHATGAPPHGRAPCHRAHCLHWPPSVTGVLKALL